MRVRPSILLFNQSHDKILFMTYQYGGTDVFGIPGGNPDSGETLIQTLRRELQEELEVQIHVNQLVCVGEILDKKGQDYTLHCVFTGEIASGVPQINPEQTTSSGIAWKTVQEIQNIVTYPDIRTLVNNLPSRERQVNPYIGTLPKKWL